MSNPETGLKRLLGPWDVIAINLGIVIGVGIFRVPSEVARYLPSAPLIILAWFLGGLICLLGAFCYSELASSIPETGGNYIYLQRSYGKLIAFLFGWTEVLVIRPGSIAAVAFIFAEYLSSFLSFEKIPLKFIAVSIVFILSLINILGLRPAKRFQNLSAFTKVFALVGIILLGVSLRKGSSLNFYSGLTPPSTQIFPLLGLALIPILWTYGGWHESTYVSGETRDYKTSLPFSLITGILLISSIYIMINLVYIYLVPVEEIMRTDLIASKAMQILWRDMGRKILEALVLISSLGCINGMILTGGRITYCLGQDNRIFRYLEEIDQRFSTPSRSILFNALWATGLIIWGTFNQLLFFTGIVVWLFFALIISGLFVLRHKFPQMERPFKVPGFPFTPLVFILICSSLVANTLFHYPWQSLAGITLTLSGIPVFFFFQKKKL